MSDLLIAIVASAGLGALIGLIRQWGEQSERRPGDFAGVRTHTVWAVLGCLGAYVSATHVAYTLPVVMALVAGHQIATGFSGADNASRGSTTFAGALITMLCGALVFWGETKPAILVAATTMVLFGLKHRIHAWTREITDQDIWATLKFVAISGVILPLVPNQAMGPFGGFNPFSTWLMVVLISGLGFAGYVAIRLVGAHSGILLTGVLGGLASSTASTLAFSRRSREDPRLSDHYAIAVVAACTVMLPRVLIATSLVNRDFALRLVLPFAGMAIPGVAYALMMWLRQRPARKQGDAPKLANPLNLWTAIKFAALYAGIAFAVTAVSKQGWTQGLLPLSFVSGLTDMDAISLSVASDAGNGQIALPLAARAVVLAAVSNTILKAGMAIALGSAGLRWRIGGVLGATMAIGVAWLVFVPDFNNTMAS